MATATDDKKGKEQEQTPVDPIEALLSGTRDQIEVRLEELRPQAEAFARLESILANFDAITNGTPVRKAGRKRGTTATAERAPRGSRLQEFVSVVQQAGDTGVTVAEAHEKMPETNQNYIYRLAKEATDAGEVRKEGKRYFIATS